ATIDLEAQLRALALERAIEADGDAVRAAHRLEALDVVDRGRGAEALAIVSRKGLAIAPQQRARRLLAERLGKRLAEPVGPAARRLGKLLFDLLGIDEGEMAGPGAQDEMDARQHRLVELGGEAVDRTGKRRFENGAKALAQRGVVAVARNVDETGDEALEGVAADEECDALAFLEIDDAERRRLQLVLANLEELVARIGLEDVQQRLAVMALRAEARALQHMLDFPAQQRDLARAAVIGERGEEAGEDALAGGLAVLIEELDADRIHRHRSMHHRAAVRLADHQQARRAQELAHIGRQGREIAQTVE